MISKRRWISGGVKVAVGSSRISTLLCVESALAISSSCIWATPSVSTRARGEISSPTWSSMASASRKRRPKSTSPARLGKRWKKMFSATVRYGSRLNSWNTTRIPARMAAKVLRGA